jgi:hypothetical protein
MTMNCLPEPAARPVDREPWCGPAAAVGIRVHVAPVAPRGRVLLAVAMAGLAWLAGPAAHASTFRWFTDQSAFTAALIPGYYTATGAALAAPGGAGLPNPKAMSGGSFGFEVSDFTGLYGLVINPGISPNLVGQSLTFSAFTPSNQVFAFAGLFSLTDGSEARQAGGIGLLLFTGAGGSTLISGTAPSIGATPTFLGLISDDSGAPITRVEFATSENHLFATAEEIIVGVPVAVPEPSTLAAAGMGALALGIAYRRRRRAERGRAVAESET